jgi:hypothetical protein
MFTTSSTLLRLARFVLVWYVLFVGLSVLVATLQPKTMDVVCSSMGLMKDRAASARGRADRSPRVDVTLIFSHGVFESVFR